MIKTGEAMQKMKSGKATGPLNINVDNNCQQQCWG